MLGRYHAYLTLAIGLTLFGSPSRALAGEERDLAFPLIFSQDDRTEIKTSACVRVREKVYGTAGVPWVSFKAAARAEPESLLTEVIAAMQEKDRDRLWELSHPSLGRNPKEFQQQVTGYFSHYERRKPGDVWGYYRFGDLVVFYLQMHFQPTTVFSYFAFALDETGNFGFLPYGNSSRSPGLEFLSYWFQSEWGPANNRLPLYCGASLLARMTHKVVLDKGSRPPGSPSELLLIGNSLTDPSAKNQPYAALKDKISALKEALKAGRWNDYFAGFTPGGRKKVGEWFSSSPEEMRQVYIENVLTQEPFYVFNADPLFVVYTRTKTAGIQALYYVQNEKNQFRWANANYITTTDGIFKHRKFFDAAGKDKPFDSMQISK